MHEIELARAGDGDAFARLTEPYRQELLAHCYKMTGSVMEAEDMVQETFLRAWKRLEQYQESGLFRAWLYRIATNACLDHLRKRKKRALMPTSIPNAKDGLPTLLPIQEDVWIEPFPGEMLVSESKSPEALYSLHESVHLAFMTVLHRLSARNRAILLLRDVLGWRAREVATFLDLTESAVHSVLKRARKEIHDAGHKKRNKVAPEIIDSFCQRYVEAWESNDVALLASLLREDVVLNMPPLPCWYGGRPYVLRFFAGMPLDGTIEGRWQAMVTQANGQTAVVLYERLAPNAPYKLFGLHVLDIADSGIRRIDNFIVGEHDTLPQPIAAPWIAKFDLPSLL